MAPIHARIVLGLRELGRVERTLFTLEWLQNPELRRRVQVGLNKGEAKNALARAVFFNRLGELRDLTPLSSTAHSGDLVLPFSSLFLEFFSSKLNHRLVACCHQTWILLLQLPAGLWTLYQAIILLDDLYVVDLALVARYGVEDESTSLSKLFRAKVLCVGGTPDNRPDSSSQLRGRRIAEPLQG